MKISNKQLRIFLVIVILSLFVLYHLEILSGDLCDGILKLCLSIFMIMFSIESIKDDEIALGGETLVKSKSPNTYWIIVIGWTAFSVVFTVYAVFRIISAFT
jgi:hypothetical protein